MGDESHDAYQAEVKRQRETYVQAEREAFREQRVASAAEAQRAGFGLTAETLTHPSVKFGGTSGPLPSPAPINDRIRELSSEVADAADVLAERRQASALADQALCEAEARFADLSAQLSTLLGDCRAGGGVNTLRATRS